MCVGSYVYMHLCVLCVCAGIYRYVCTCARVHVFMHIYMYFCIYIVCVRARIHIISSSTHSHTDHEFGICSGQNLTRTRIMTRVQTIKEFSQDIHNSQSILNPLPHLTFSQLPSIPKTFSIRSLIPSFQGLYHVETFTSLKFSSPRGLLHSETLPVSKTSAPNPKLQQQIILDLRRQLYNSFLSRVHSV